MTSTSLTKADPAKAAIEEARTRGVTEISRRQLMNELYKQLDGASWGSVHGTSLSPAVKAALAAFCYNTQADPLTHIEILGGRPYLTAEYWREKAATHPRFVDSAQTNITADKSKCAEWGVPSDAMAAWETEITYFLAAAPIEAIQAGKVGPDAAQKWMRTARECNWVTGEKDPVGRAHPHKTARSRSFRRAAKLAFAAWMPEQEASYQRASQALEAEWEELDAEVVPEANPDAVMVGTGEAQAATVEPDPAENEPPGEPKELLDDARKRYMATLRDLKLAKDRKAWQQRRDFPASVTEWSLADFDRADGLLLDPLRKAVAALCEETDTDLEVLSNTLWGIAAPDYAKHWIQAHKMLEQKKASVTVPEDQYESKELDL